MDEIKKLQFISSLAQRTSTKRARQSRDFLLRNAAFLAAYEDLEAFAFAAFDHDDQRAKAVEYHLCQLRASIIRELWSRQLFLSINTIEQLLFHAFSNGGDDPLAVFSEAIFNNGLHHPGFVLYPLHSFGFLGAGIFRLFGREVEPRIDLLSAGISLTAQTNGLSGSAAFLDRTRRRLGIAHTIPEDLLEHFHRSRDLRWYTQNPLLAVKISSYTSGYHENQRILEMKLRTSATLIAMMAVMGKRQDPEGGQDFSTRRVNNWQTLDIRHYLLFQAQPRSSELRVDCTPMHLNQVEMAELSDLGVDIDASAWKASKRAQLSWISQSLSRFETAFLRHCVIGSGDTTATRLHRKILGSINYFRRSLRARSYEPDNVVALAIAFETLLVDEFTRGVTGLILERTRRCLKGIAGVANMHQAVDDLFQARGAIVHVGSADTPSSLELARKAYVYCFRDVMERLATVPKVPEKPLSTLFA